MSAAEPAGGRPYEIVRSPRARTIRLSVDPATGIARLTVPRRAGLRSAIAWADERIGWIEAQQSRLPRPVPFVPGGEIPVEGVTRMINWSASGPRKPRLSDTEILVGGPVELLSGRLTRWLRATALERLTGDTAHFANRAGVSVAHVAIGDPRRRWGSCASDGRIRYSWRLILAPAFVRRATAAHEVAHRLHMNHGPEFHAAVAQILGEDPRPAHDWLRRNGPALHWYGRE